MENENKKMFSKIAIHIFESTIGRQFNSESLGDCNSVLAIMSGYEYAQQEDKWVSIHEDLPITWETGNWDGKRSDEYLVLTNKGEVKIAVLYSGIMDGNEFNDWYDQNGFEINVVGWSKIPEF